jgi:hypothetical protein
MMIGGDDKKEAEKQLKAAKRRAKNYEAEIKKKEDKGK